MHHDWLLVETLGAEPAVVAQGEAPRISSRSAPFCDAIRT